MADTVKLRAVITGNRLQAGCIIVFTFARDTAPPVLCRGGEVRGRQPALCPRRGTAELAEVKAA